MDTGHKARYESTPMSTVSGKDTVNRMQYYIYEASKSKNQNNNASGSGYIRSININYINGRRKKIY